MPLVPIDPAVLALGFDLLRPDDLLSLRVSFVGLELTQHGTFQRVASAAGRDAHIIVEFEPQHVTERAFFETAQGFPLRNPLPTGGPDLDIQNGGQPPAGLDDPPDPLTPVGSRIAGRSSLVFTLPAHVMSIKADQQTLLEACTTYPLRIVGRAISPLPVLGRNVKPPPVTITDPPTTAAPTGVTAIEAPWRLVLSPNEFGAWLHALHPVASKGDPHRIELWHTRLGIWHAVSAGVGVETPNVGGPINDGRYIYEQDAQGERRVTEVLYEPNDHYRAVRAIASPDLGDLTNPPQSAPKGPPFRMALDRRDRHELVHLTSDFALTGARNRVVRANRLMLSSLGAWLDLDYGTSAPDTKDLPNPNLTVLAWRHIAALGRDHYVRVIYDGVTCGFPFPASLVKVTERKFDKDGGAILRQRMYVVLRRLELTFPPDWRCLPYRRVRAKTWITPSLDDPTTHPPPASNPQIQVPGTGDMKAFWMYSAGKPFPFHLVCEDWEGQQSELRLPLIFIRDDGLHDDTLGKAVEEYNKRAELHQCDGNGQAVAFAETDSGSRGKTTFRATELEFGAVKSGDPLVKPAGPLSLPPEMLFAPRLTSASVRVPAIDRLLGPGQPLSITLDEDYVATPDWLSTSKGQVFARASPSSLAFTADKAGGVVTPNINIGGLSRQFGPVGGDAGTVDEFSRNASFKPGEFFSGAKILGGIDLATIVDPTFADNNIPTLTSAPVFPDPAKPPTQIQTRLAWDPTPVQSGPFQTSAATKVHVDTTVTTDLQGQQTSDPTTTGTISKFTMNLWGFVMLDFNSIAFTVTPGHKPDFSADVTDVTFGGPLAFVQELDKYMGDFSDRPSVAVTPDGVKLGYSLELPEIAVGVLTIQNISLGASLNLPFTGEPVRFRFAFCERDRPFGLLVYIFGGGGFFAIAIGLDGVEQLEASLEFGAAIEIDIGVASGGVHVMAGIYFSWQEPQDAAWLEGYLRLGGELDVLGLVSLSLEFLMSLAYDSGGGDVWGEATLVAEISVVCFHTSIEMSVRREFGDPERPLISALIIEDDWTEYWSSFAPLAA
jgi:hypothetical protein